MLAGNAGAAQAHGFSTAVYLDVTSSEPGVVHTDLGLEYDLLIVSVADAEDDDALFRAGQPAWEDADFPAMVSALREHTDALGRYLQHGLAVSQRGTGCTPTLDPDVSVSMDDDQGVPYAHLGVDWRCPGDSGGALSEGHTIRSGLFADSEGYVAGATTIATYDLDGARGSAALDPDHPSFSTTQTTGTRFWEFYRLGIEHLLTGLDHLLFLTALILGSRSTREVVLAASTFTVAHSTTLVLAAFGVIHVPADVVEPLIALSIAATAAWMLWRLWRRGDRALVIDPSAGGRLGLDRAGWTRLGIVLGFGLVHGMGFAGALGIDHAWSWTLLWSLLVFNLGIETVQLALVAAVFPVLLLLRRRAPGPARWLTVAVGAFVAVAGLLWFVQRVAGISLIPG